MKNGIINRYMSMIHPATQISDQTESPLCPTAATLPNGQLFIAMTPDQNQACMGIVSIAAAGPQLETLATIATGIAGGREQAMNMVLSLLHGIGPKNAQEGMVAVQMVMAHILSLHFTGQAFTGKHSPHFVELFLRNANKAQNNMLRLTNQLQQMRQGGQTVQKVVVERVEVQSGGQAVVGAVAAGVGAAHAARKE
jgi:hypothetical protein